MFGFFPPYLIRVRCVAHIISMRLTQIARDRNRMLPLMNLLENYTFERVVNFFVKKPVDHGAAAASASATGGY